MFFRMVILLIISITLFQCDFPTPPDELPPLVTMISPGTMISENFTLVIEASDDKKIVLVWAYLDNVRIGETSKKPYEFEVDISDYRDGLSHTIQAFAIDKTGNIGESERVTFIVGDITAPIIDILYPQTGNILSGVVNIFADIQDNVQVSRAEFFIDGNLAYTDNDGNDGWSYSWNTDPFADGLSHSIYIRAYDSSNNSSYSEAISVTISTATDDIPPNVLIIYPLNASTVSGLINIVADITDNVLVEKAEFYVDGILINTDTDGSNGWAANWDATDAITGAHSIYVKGYDSSGNENASILITVNIL